MQYFLYKPNINCIRTDMNNIIYIFLTVLVISIHCIQCNGPSGVDTAPVPDTLISTKGQDTREKLSTLSRYIPMQSIVLDSDYIIRREKTAGTDKGTIITVTAKLLVPKSAIGNWLCGLQPSDGSEVPLSWWGSVGTLEPLARISPPRFYRSRDGRKNMVLFRDDGVVYLLFRINKIN